MGSLLSGNNPQFVIGDGGLLYFVSTAGGSNLTGAIAAVDAGAGTVTTLYSFAAGTTAPRFPVSLVRGSDGLFYGATALGGANGDGTIFTYNAATAVFTKVYDFCSLNNCGDGEMPEGLLQASDGSFYGVTSLGGSAAKGVLFKFNPVTHVLSVLQSLTYGGGSTNPLSTPVEGADGNLYGVQVTSLTGSLSIWQYNLATQSFTTMFTSSVAYSAVGSLYAASDGLLYGASKTGGLNAGGFLFTYQPGAHAITDIYDFPLTGAVGHSPVSNLVQGVDGSFYGATAAGAQSLVGGLFNMKVPGVTTAPLQLTPAASTIAAGTSFAVNFTAINAFSVTTQQCYLYELNNATGLITSTYGPLTGTASSNGFAGSASIPAPIVGTYTVTMVCGGGLSANGFVLTVNAAYDTTTTTVTANPSTIPHTGSTVLTASVANPGNASYTPQGPVSFMLGNTVVGSCTLSAGSCTATVAASALAAGSNTITAKYAPTSANWQASSGSTTVTVADIVFTSVSHNFGSWTTGTSTSGTSNYAVGITNNTGSTVTFTVAMTGSSEFSQTNNCGGSLGAGKVCSIVFVFAPTATGTVTAQWSLTGVSPAGLVYGFSNGGTLTATGVSGSGLTLTTNGHNFYSVAVSHSSAIFGAVLTNTTLSAVTFNVGSTPAPFSQSLNNCPASLAPGASCNLQWIFSPTATGYVTATVPISASQPILFGSAPVTGMKLAGTGTAFLALNLTASSLNYGNVLIGDLSGILGVVISNSSTAAASLIIATPPAPFTQVLNTCPASLPAGATCVVEWVFEPTIKGGASGTIGLTSSLPIYAGSTPVSGITLLGTGN